MCFRFSIFLTTTANRTVSTAKYYIETVSMISKSCLSLFSGVFASGRILFQSPYHTREGWHYRLMAQQHHVDTIIRILCVHLDAFCSKVHTIREKAGTID
jgi:hypothetical protein